MNNRQDLPRNAQGVKMYPVCNWMNNQHKLHNASDRVFNAMIDAQESGNDAEACELAERLEEIDRLIAVFNGNIINGVVYAVWADYKAIKDYIGAYDLRH